VGKGSIQKLPDSLKKICSRTKGYIRDMTSKGTGNSEFMRLTVPKILACIFGYWSLAKSGESFFSAREAGKANLGDFLLQPHPIQVLSILLFVGCDDKDSVLENLKSFFRPKKMQSHLVQVKTGEGKSVLLGVLSVLLALMGNEVYEACYSEHLSSRDY
jgi:hypothetical protein